MAIRSGEALQVGDGFEVPNDHVAHVGSICFIQESTRSMMTVLLAVVHRWLAPVGYETCKYFTARFTAVLRGEVYEPRANEMGSRLDTQSHIDMATFRAKH
jgi:hypothetical protein